MGFLDKAKEQASALASKAQDAANQGQAKLDASQAKKHADGLLRDLGAWYYAQRTGRDNGTGSAEIERVYAELQAHEAEHGRLGGDRHDQPSPVTTAAEAVPDVANPPTPIASPPAAPATASAPPPPPPPATPVAPSPPSPSPAEPIPAAPADPASSAPGASASAPGGNFTLDDL